MPLTALPVEVLQVIIRKHLLPPDQSLLALRGSCKTLYKIIPLKYFLSVSDETAKWLLGGKAVRWEESMNTEDISASFYDGAVSIRVHSIHDIHVSDDTIIDDTTIASFLIVGEDVIMYIRTLHSFDKASENICIKDINAAATCKLEHAHRQYFMLYDGRLLETKLYGCNEQIKSSFKNMLTNSTNTIAIPDRLRDMFGRFNCKQMKATSPFLFWFMSSDGDLDYSFVKHPAQMTQVAAGVQMFDLINGAAVFLTLDGTIKLVNAKYSEIPAWTYTVQIKIDEASYFWLTPTLHSMWIINSERQLIRYGQPFVIPVHDNEDQAHNQPSSYFSVNALQTKLLKTQAKLSQTEAKLQALEDEKANGLF